LFHVGFTLIHGDPVFQRGLVFDDARREMGHDIIPLSRNAAGRVDHVLYGRAFDVGYVHTRACRQQRSEVFHFGRCAWHDLN